MKLTITYEYDPTFEPCYFAKTKTADRSLLAGGDDWEDAKKHLLEKIRRAKGVTVPPDEEVTL